MEHGDNRLPHPHFTGKGSEVPGGSGLAEGYGSYLVFVLPYLPALPQVWAFPVGILASSPSQSAGSHCPVLTAWHPVSPLFFTW